MENSDYDQYEWNVVFHINFNGGREEMSSGKNVVSLINGVTPVFSWISGNVLPWSGS